MPNTFSITAATNTVSLDASGQGEASFTVSNVSGHPIRGLARIVPENPAAQPWLSLAGEPERDFATGDTQQFIVRVAVPKGAPAGSYTFRLDVVGVINPDEEFEQGPAVTFVAAATAVTHPFPWWILVVAAVILVVLVGGGTAAYLLTRPTPTPNPTVTAVAVLTSTPTVAPSAAPTATGTVPPTPFGGSQGGHLAFISFRDGTYELYVMNADGSEQKRLTTSPGSYVGFAAWSPDGKRLAFTSGPIGATTNILVIGADGTGTVPLTTTGNDDQPAWSPDGTRIAFASNRDGNREIYVMNADGSNQQRLTNSPLADNGPVWSPDGTLIAYVEATGDSNEQAILIMKADGTLVRRLTNNRAYNFQPAWSPDGQRIAFVTNVDGGFFEIYVANADGSRQLRLTNNNSDDTEPAWSPDGRTIAFSHAEEADGHHEIYSVPADASGAPQALTRGTTDKQSLAWSPDGRHLVYEEQSGQFKQIVILDVESGGARTLTNTTNDNTFPHWQP